MSIITVQNLTFAYDGTYQNIFENTSFTMDSSMRIGLTARNGRGKTTLLKILAGELEYSGSVRTSVRFDYFPYEVEDEELTAVELIAGVAGLDRELDEWRIVRELGLLDVQEEALYRPFCTLSGGERSKVQLAALFLRDNNFLLIDEPTNHLDMDARKTLGDYLVRKEGFILVSHDRALLDRCTTHTMAINKTGITIEAATFSTWEANREARDRMEARRNERLKHEIDRLETAMKRGEVWADKVEAEKIGQGVYDRGYIGAHSAKMMKRAKSTQARIQRMIDEKSELLRDTERTFALKLESAEHYRETLFELSDVSLSYDGNIVFSNLSLKISRGERLCLSGKNGCGKSSLIKLLLGELEPDSGLIRRAPNMKISLVTQDTEGMRGSVYDFAEEGGIDLTQFLTILRKLDFPREQFEKDLSQLSSGQRKKAMIARSLCEHAHIYIWDEPLNYIDVQSRMQIEELLLNYQPTMLFVEHDEVFREKIATRVIDMD